MRQEKTRKLSIKAKILIPCMLVNLVACVTIGFLLYSMAKEELMEDYQPDSIR